MLNKAEKGRRLRMMIAGAFAIFFTGYPHVWSIYQPYVMAEAGWTQGQASMCFYLVLCTFVFGNILGGKMRTLCSLRQILLIGGGLFSAGVLGSAFLIMDNPVPVYLTYGVIQGIGQGIIYATIVPVAQSWFPGRTGFASGVIVTANGLCGLFLAPVSSRLLEAGGVKTALLVIGSAVALSWVLSVCFVTPSTEIETDEMTADKKVPVQHQYTSGEMVRTREFYLLFATMFFGLISYFMLSPVSQTLQMEQGVPAVVAVSAVMIGSVINASARLILPSIADKIGRIPCIMGVIVAAVTAMAVLTVSGGYVTTAAVIMMYGCYGGIMGSFPSLTSTIFGLENSGENYGFVMFGIVAANLGAPIVTGAITGTGHSMQQVFMAGAGCAALSLIFMMLLKNLLNKKTLRKGKVAWQS